MSTAITKENILITHGTKRIAMMLLAPNIGSRKDNEHICISEEFPLYKYSNIGTLVIPESVDIPHDEWYSSFASHKQRGFVWNHPTECQKIQISHIENHSPHLAVEDGVIYSADRSRLIFCFQEKTSFVVPDSVTIIEPYAFCLQKKLKNIVLHDRITFIGRASFMACNSLSEIIIPKRIKHIASDTFDGCTSLCKVILPGSLESIGDCAFRQCKALNEIKLPDSIKSICSFEGCSALQKIEIPKGVEEITGFMFCHSLRKVILHQGVKRIDNYAFRYCENLKDINFPEGLEYIGARAFYPASLGRIVFPTTLQEIGCEAFYHNHKLYSIKFKSHVKIIEQAAFACCPFLFKIGITKPDDMIINENVFIQDTGLDKFGFWD